MIRIALPMIAFATMGCMQQHKDVPPPIPPVPSTCGEEHFQIYVGKTRTDSIVAEIASLSQPAAKAIRWIEPGTAVTMDFRPDRLNVHLDDKGVITDFRCG